VLLHPVGSKVSSHAFDAHFNVFDLRLSDWTNHRNEQGKQGKFFRAHRSSFP
jgi:hypothetical protein